MIAVAAPAPLRMRALFVVPAVIAIVLVAALLVDSGSHVPATRASLRLSDIPQGATSVEVAGKAVLLVRNGDDVRALVPGTDEDVACLDRYETIVRWDEVVVDTGSVVAGPGAEATMRAGCP